MPDKPTERETIADLTTEDLMVLIQRAVRNELTTHRSTSWNWPQDFCQDKLYTETIFKGGARVEPLRYDPSGSGPGGFDLGITPANIRDLAKTQVPRLEADYARFAERQRTLRELETTKRWLILAASVCLLGGAALVVFAPTGRSGVSYFVAAILAILPLGAIGVQDFRIKVTGGSIEGGKASTRSASDA